MQVIDGVAERVESEVAFTTAIGMDSHRATTRLNAKALGPFLFILCIISLSVVNISSLFSFALSLLLVFVAARVFFPKTNITLTLSLHAFYSLLAIALYLFQLWAIPEFQGLSGPPGGIGTDDAQFFFHATPQVPDDFPIKWFSVYKPVPYAQFLGVFGQIIFSVLKKLTPLDLVLITVVSLTFLPIAVSKTALLVTGDHAIARLAFRLSALCPFTLASGLILLSDVWTAMLMIGGLYFFLAGDYKRLLPLALFLFFLREESAVLLAINMTFFFAYKLFREKPTTQKQLLRKMLSLLGAASMIVIMTFFLSSRMQDFMAQKGIDLTSFSRPTYSEGFMADGLERSGGNSPQYKITKLPIVLRLPLGTTFMLGAPFVSVKSIYFSGCTSTHFCYSGVFVPRSVMANIYAFLFLFVYFRGLIAGFATIIVQKLDRMSMFALVYVVDALIISQLSLQGRHKLWIMPLFYILVAYGFRSKFRRGPLVDFAMILFLILTIFVNAQDFGII